MEAGEKEGKGSRMNGSGPYEFFRAGSYLPCTEAFPEVRVTTGKIVIDESITLGQLLRHMVSSDRIVIENEGKEVLYKGYVGCSQYGNIDETRKVKQFGLSTEIFRKELRPVYITGQRLKERIPVERISDFKFSELEMLIYTKIVLED